jgi:hypothetical protein
MVQLPSMAKIYVPIYIYISFWPLWVVRPPPMGQKTPFFFFFFSEGHPGLAKGVAEFFPWPKWGWLTIHILVSHAEPPIFKKKLKFLVILFFLR